MNDPKTVRRGPVIEPRKRTGAAVSGFSSRSTIQLKSGIGGLLSSSSTISFGFETSDATSTWSSHQFDVRAGGNETVGVTAPTVASLPSRAGTSSGEKPSKLRNN